MSPVAPHLGNVVVGALWGWLIFTGLVGWATFSFLMAASSLDDVRVSNSEDVAQSLSMAVVFAGWAILIGGFVSFLVTLIVGVPLARFVGHLLRNVSAWQLHVAGLFAVGTISSSLALLVAGLVGEGYGAIDALPIYAIAAALAGTSAALGWVILWRFPARRNEPRAVYAESVASR